MFPIYWSHTVCYKHLKLTLGSTRKKKKKKVPTPGLFHLKSTLPLWKTLEFKPKSMRQFNPDPEHFQKIHVPDPEKIYQKKGKRNSLNSIQKQLKQILWNPTLNGTWSCVDIKIFTVFRLEIYTNLAVVTCWILHFIIGSAGWSFHIVTFLPQGVCELISKGIAHMHT